MERARHDHTLVPGEHCRFCPSKLACPLLTGLFKVAISTDAKTMCRLTNEQLALDYQQIAGVKHFAKALEAEMMSRLNKGEKVSGGAPENTWKLVPGRSNRVLKPEGLEAIKEGEIPFDKADAYENSLKSVAQLEKISPKAAKWVKEYAFTPQHNLTVAPSTDKRAAVKVSSPEEDFGEYVKSE
jgi:hypothetical protein